jgi:hypothetical protein
MLGLAGLGAVIAGAYGILHDQITFTLSPEYFTRLKFKQFHYADFGLPRRVFVGEIGFLATWWAGFIAGWSMARVTVGVCQPHEMLRRSLRGFLIVVTLAVVAGCSGYFFGIIRPPDPDTSRLAYLAESMDVTDVPAFVRVAYIHNAGYLGGLIGLIIAIVYTKREVRHR